MFRFFGKQIFIPVTLAVLTVPVASSASEVPLAEFVQRPDESFSFTRESVQTFGTDSEAHILRLTSQSWKETEWQHRLTVAIPSKIEHLETAVLLISGGSNKSERSFDRIEFQLSAKIAETIGVPVAVLEQVPNQPLMGGLNEDELIAHTFSRYLETGDSDWPLLFPMVKSATSAMDALTAFLAEESGSGPTRFILTGASKRGWTTWLTAAVDERVLAIAPMVFDILNFHPQLAQQREYFHGGYSPQIRAYEEQALFSLLESTAGSILADAVDPLSYRDRLTMPKLILLGTNDPYWTVDASSLYFHELSGQKHLFYAPNTGHGLGETAVPTLIAFIQNNLSGNKFPTLEWSRESDEIRANWDQSATKVLLWSASAPTRNFREATWTSRLLSADDGAISAQIPTPENGFTASFIEVQFPSPHGTFGLSTEIFLSESE